MKIWKNQLIWWKENKKTEKRLLMIESEGEPPLFYSAQGAFRLNPSPGQAHIHWRYFGEWNHTSHYLDLEGDSYVLWKKGVQQSPDIRLCSLGSDLKQVMHDAERLLSALGV